ncbi:MAG: ATP-binding cassette domain-containing protein, partial [Erysipelotrichaceae bacterium]|nr:ATP-binding cassette domain-containing protein [Erysipelotrichaceae bacterium]
MIKVENLYKNYGKDIEVLKDINFTFEEGKTYAIIGSSGGGKSTFIRCLNMLESPSKGNIYFKDLNITSKNQDLNKVREKMGMVFQNFNLFAHMNVQ